MKTVAESYYHRLEYVDNFNNLEDIFFKSLISDELIPAGQKALHEAIEDIMVPVHTATAASIRLSRYIATAFANAETRKNDMGRVVFGDGGNDIESGRLVCE